MEEKFGDLNLVVSHESDRVIDDMNIAKIEVIVTLLDGSNVHIKKVHDWKYEASAS